MRRQAEKIKVVGTFVSGIQRVHRTLAPHAYSVILGAALACTLAAKFYHAFRCEVTYEYLTWITTDVSVLLGLEALLAMICYRWRSDWVIRMATIIAAVACTWSVINAAWIIRMGTQILPVEVLPLIKDPFNHFHIVGVTLTKMPVAAFALLGPSAVALTFFIVVLARPAKPRYSSRRLFFSRIAGALLLVIVAVPARTAVSARPKSSQVATSGLQYNSQLKALASMVLPDASPIHEDDFLAAHREIPTAQQIDLPQRNETFKSAPNVVVVILESIQYAYTSMGSADKHLTPYLQTFADQGVLFTQMRSTLTHTSKAIFSLMTGRYPCASQDVVEAIPARASYAGLPTILKHQSGYRTAFFQSAKGDFESRPSLVENLGFDRYWAREQLHDPNKYLGYLAADEFALIDPMARWIQSDKRTPFLLTIMCSAAHDPYEVPTWYDEPAKEVVVRYEQVVSYTDAFLKALDHSLASLGVADNTIVCIVGDHAEAFGEHGKHGHEKVGFEEALRIVWALRSPQGIRAGTHIDQPVSSIDVTPTLLALLGFDESQGFFDGDNAMAPMPPDRRVFFSGWVPEGPAGYIMGNRKYLHNPSVNELVMYDLEDDPLELNRLELSEPQVERVTADIIAWRKTTLFNTGREPRGRQYVFGQWLCRWSGRDSVTKYIE